MTVVCVCIVSLNYDDEDDDGISDDSDEGISCHSLMLPLYRPLLLYVCDFLSLLL